jgi:hypothetical protein
MSIDRQRLAGLIMTIGGSIGMAIGVVALLADVRLWGGFIFAIWIPIGIGQLIRAKKRRVLFESEHGLGAGRQKSIT